MVAVYRDWGGARIFDQLVSYTQSMGRPVGPGPRLSGTLFRFGEEVTTASMDGGWFVLKDEAGNFVWQAPEQENEPVASLYGTVSLALRQVARNPNCLPAAKELAVLKACRAIRSMLPEELQGTLCNLGTKTHIDNTWAVFSSEDRLKLLRRKWEDVERAMTAFLSAGKDIELGKEEPVEEPPVFEGGLDLFKRRT